MLRDALALSRLGVVMRANLVALWSSVAVLVVLRLTFTSDSNLTICAVVLGVGGLILLAGRETLRRGRLAATAILIVLANWLSAVGVTYASPFVMPVGLFALLLPAVLLVEFVPPRVLAAMSALTAVAMSGLAGMGEWRRGTGESLAPGAWITVPLVMLFVVAVVSVLAIGLWQQAKRLTEQTHEIERSRSRLASAADDARRAIERDLHDGAQQRLSTLSVRLGRVARLVRDDPVEAESALATAHAELHDAIRELRDLAHGIYPALLEQRGLGPALSAAARRATRPCRVDATGLGRHPAPVENAVYFCCLEAVHNADRHSGAGRIDVRVTDEDGGVAFSVADDGAGFDPARVPSRGLTGMLDRVRAAGGTLRIESAPGAGTVVSGRVTPRG